MFTSNVNEFLDHSSSGMSPMQKIRAAAKQQGIRLKPADQGCKHCHGRGYIGFRHDPNKEYEDQDPIPCQCIFVKEKNDVEIGEVELKPRNRKERRERERKAGNAKG